MHSYTQNPEDSERLQAFLFGKSDHTLLLFHHFIEAYQTLGNVILHPTKSMIGVSSSEKKVAWITQLSKNFIHIVFPFAEPHTNNLCFTKIAQVPGDANQYNHHFRMYQTEDVNEEVLQYMLLACKY